MPLRPSFLRRSLGAPGLLLLLAACSEYGTTPLAQDPAAGDDSPTADETGVAGAKEACDGLDDDGDGLVDEGLDDSNDDGVADCLQCSVEARDPETTDRQPACDAGEPAEDPWQAEEVWRWEDGRRGYGCRLGPVVDLDGDGDSDIICLVDHRMVALDGSTGEELWSWSDVDGLTPSAAGDVDGDGSIDIVLINSVGSIVALERDGSMKWASEVRLGPTRLGSIIRIALRIADLDGDGQAEVLTHHGIVSGQDGSLVGLLDSGEDHVTPTTEIAVADLDGDGVHEILHGGRAYSPDGAVLWQVHPMQGRSWTAVYPAVLQADEDPEGEVAWVVWGGFAPGEVILVDDDGAVLWRERTPNETAHGRPCAADLDGDGLMELVMMDREYVQAWRPDGTHLWTVPRLRTETEDTPHVLGPACTAFNFDLEGGPEVLVRNGRDVYILDGETGQTRLHVPTHLAGVNRAAEALGIADLDGDGSVELLVPNTDVATGREPYDLRILRHPDRAWPPGGPSWLDETWSSARFWPDGTLRSDPLDPWIDPGLWRGQPSVAVWGADLIPEIADSCVVDEELGELRLSVRLVNLGPQQADDGGTVTLHAGGPDGHVLGTLTFDGPIPPGTSTATREWVSRSVVAEEGLSLIADGGGEHDCDPGNNQVDWSPP